MTKSNNWSNGIYQDLDSKVNFKNWGEDLRLQVKGAE